MMDLVNVKDAKEKEEFDKIVEKAAKISLYSKLISYNKPAVLIVSAVIGATINGSTMPIFGMIFSYLLTVLTAPKAFLEE
jgi:hypothetical protein